jgi:hypothetical protein
MIFRTGAAAGQPCTLVFDAPASGEFAGDSGISISGVTDSSGECFAAPDMGLTTQQSPSVAVPGAPPDLKRKIGWPTYALIAVPVVFGAWLIFKK